jgi:hypothetical protein
MVIYGPHGSVVTTSEVERVLWDIEGFCAFVQTRNSTYRFSYSW